MYEVDQSNHLTEEIIQERLREETLDTDLQQFCIQIVQGIFPRRVVLDQYIQLHAPEWPLDQVAIIDRNILRIALWELAFSTDTPMKVVINEAVELAKKYGSDSTPRFVNGVLGSLVSDMNKLKQHFQSNKEIPVES
jgi:N utilization substance protein B